MYHEILTYTPRAQLHGVARYIHFNPGIISPVLDSSGKHYLMDAFGIDPYWFVRLCVTPDRILEFFSLMHHYRYNPIHCPITAKFMVGAFPPRSCSTVNGKRDIPWHHKKIGFFLGLFILYNYRIFANCS